MGQKRTPNSREGRATRQLAVSREPENGQLKKPKHVTPHSPNDEERPFLPGSDTEEEGWTIQHIAAACVTFALAAIVTTILYLYVYAGAEKFHTLPPTVQNSSSTLGDSLPQGAPQGATPGLLPPQPPAPPVGAPVTIEVYYGTTCTNCQNFVSQALGPLLDSGLTGDQVKMVILPWIPDYRDDTTCRMQLDCTFALAPLCALKGTFPEPLAIDSPAMQSAGQFVACDLADTAAGSNPPRNARRIDACAAAAGLQGAALKACADGHEGLGILHGQEFQAKIGAAHAKIKQIEGEVMAPFVFLDGELVHCLSPQWCKALWGADGRARPLADPGSFFSVVCARLGDPQPEACRRLAPQKEVSASQEKEMVKKAKECHNC